MPGHRKIWGYISEYKNSDDIFNIRLDKFANSLGQSIKGEKLSVISLEYFYAVRTLDGYIAKFIKQKMGLIAAMEAEGVLTPALIEVARAAGLQNGLMHFLVQHQG